MYHPLPVDDNQAIVLKLWTCFTSRPSHRPRTVGTRLTSSISFSLSVSDNQHYFRFYIGQTWNTPWCSQLWWWPPPPSPSVLGKGRMGRTSAVSPTSKWSSWPGRAQPLLSRNQYKCGVFLEELISASPITWLGALPDALAKVII